MQPLDLNLSTRPYRNNALLWTACVLGVAGVVAFTAWNVRAWQASDARYREIAGQVRGFDEQLRDLEQRRARATREFRKYDVGILGREALKANEVIEWKAFSWTRLFNRLEEVHPWDIHMTSIEPIFRGEAGQAANLVDEERKSVPIQLQGIAKDLDALWTFERNLFDSPYFFQVEPERHSREERGDLQFALRVTYFPEGQPGERPVRTAGETPGAEGDREDADGAAEPAEPAAAADTDPDGDAVVGEGRS